MERLGRAFSELHIPYDDRVLETFRLYRDLVLSRNETLNLTAITEPDAFVRKHFIDSVRCWAWPERQAAETVVDVGTGAGFPGVPLAILCPDTSFLLVDALQSGSGRWKRSCPVFL
jgi:16S rRNA (guanine527-N7)-methyltransferase